MASASSAWTGWSLSTGVHQRPSRTGSVVTQFVTRLGDEHVQRAVRFPGEFPSPHESTTDRLSRPEGVLRRVLAIGLFVLDGAGLRVPAREALLADRAGWSLGSGLPRHSPRGSPMQYVALAVVVALVVAVVGQIVFRRYQNAPLRREMRTQAITFRTELDWVKIPDPPWWAREAEDGLRGMELIVRGGMFEVSTVFRVVIGLEYCFRARETTIELSRNPLRIYGMDTRREWIVVRGRQADRDIQLAMTKRHFLDDVWNALVAAGAVPTSGGSSPQAGHEASDP